MQFHADMQSFAHKPFYCIIWVTVGTCLSLKKNQSKCSAGAIKSNRNVTAIASKELLLWLWAGVIRKQWLLFPAFFASWREIPPWPRRLQKRALGAFPLHCSKQRVAAS
jgi:hypothetical protein